MSHLTQILTWILNNKTEFLADVTSLIGAASALALALAKLTDVLVVIFPPLKGLDGKLHWAVAWLDGLAQSKLLNAVALNPTVKPEVTK